LPDVDVDTFTMARFFGTGAQRFLVDVLDDQSYDDDFRIYRALFPSDDVEKKPGVRQAKDMRQRGSTLARSGEDLIEQEHLFAKVPDTPPSAMPLPPQLRSIEADVVHYNPQWRIRMPSGEFDELYLLPSRKPPRTPTVARPQDPKLRRSEFPVELDSPIVD